MDQGFTGQDVMESTIDRSKLSISPMVFLTLSSSLSVNRKAYGGNCAFGCSGVNGRDWVLVVGAKGSIVGGVVVGSAVVRKWCSGGQYRGWWLGWCGG